MLSNSGAGTTALVLITRKIGAASHRIWPACPFPVMYREEPTKKGGKGSIRHLFDGENRDADRYFSMSRSQADHPDPAFRIITGSLNHRSQIFASPS